MERVFARYTQSPGVHPSCCIKLGIVAHGVIPTLEKQRQEDPKFKVSLSLICSGKTAWDPEKFFPKDINTKLRAVTKFEGAARSPNTHCYLCSIEFDMFPSTCMQMFIHLMNYDPVLQGDTTEGLADLTPFDYYNWRQQMAYSYGGRVDVRFLCWCPLPLLSYMHFKGIILGGLASV